MAEYPDLPLLGEAPADPVAYVRRARWSPTAAEYGEAGVVAGSRDVYLVESRSSRDPVWVLRPLGDFRGGRGLARGVDRLLSVPWLPCAGLLAYEREDSVRRTVDVLRHLNPGWCFRPVRVREVRTVLPLDEEYVGDRVLRELEEAARSSGDFVRARAAAEAAAELRSARARVAALEAERTAAA